MPTSLSPGVQPVPVPVPIPGPKTTIALMGLVIAAIGVSMLYLVSVEDTVRLKALVEDSGPVQLTGQIAVACAFALCLLYTFLDPLRRRSYLMLSYLLMFYTLREADYHYKVSEYAKATQIKRFYSHEMIPLTTKLFMATIIILFLVTLYRYLNEHRDVFLQALRHRLPWAIFAAAWGVTFGVSQIIDQVPLFHTAFGQIFEEVLEASAEVLALMAVIIFRFQINNSP